MQGRGKRAKARRIERAAAVTGAHRAAKAGEVGAEGAQCGDLWLAQGPGETDQCATGADHGDEAAQFGV